MFEQPIIGQPDVIPGPSSRGELLCDEDIALGRSALCDTSCTLEPGAREHGCGRRLTLSDSGATLDVRGLREVELTVTACAPITRTALIESSSGASVAMAGTSLHVLGGDGASLAEHERFFPEGEDCEDRTLLFADGQLELVEPGQRWCSAQLPRFDARWAIALAATRSVEVCLRDAAPSGS